MMFLASSVRRICIIPLSIALVSIMFPVAAQPGEAHIGSVDQALVAIEVTSSASDAAVQAVRRGNGFVIRCDGIVLAPAGLFSQAIVVAGQAEAAGKQSICVIVHPGTPQERRYNAKRPRFYGKEIGYVVFRMDGFHGPALRTLLPERLKPETELSVVYSAWDGSGRPLPPQHRTTKYVRFAPSDAGPQGTDGLSDTFEGIPAGSVVTGPDGMAVGMITGSGSSVKTDTFLTFSVLHKATNCVTAASATDAEAESEAKDKKLGPMVQVAGGRVKLGMAVMGEQPDQEGDSSPCVAPFQIDQFEVTNDDYLNYWESVPFEKRKMLGFRNSHYPLSWSRNEPPFPGSIAKMPVIGITLAAAMDYAKWAGKRLPTPYEWMMAAFGPGGQSNPPPWLGAYIAERQHVWGRVRQLHEDYLRQHPEGQQERVFLAGMFQIPWIVRSPILAAFSKYSHDVILQFLQPTADQYRDPLYLTNVGGRDFDMSPCGARDMLLNASELVQPYPGVPARGEARYMELTWTTSIFERNDPWRPLKIDAQTDGGPLPPISRLYRRALLGPTVEDLVVTSNLNETIQMLAPLSGWQLLMTGGLELHAMMWPRGVAPYGIPRPAGFQPWQTLPPRSRQEMGRPVPLSDSEANAPQNQQLIYVLPTGFRCVR